MVVLEQNSAENIGDFSSPQRRKVFMKDTRVKITKVIYLAPLLCSL